MTETENKIIKAIIPLEPYGEFRIEPIGIIEDGQSFSLIFKFYNKLVISSKAISRIKDLDNYIKQNCLLLLDTVLKGVKK